MEYAKLQAQRDEAESMAISCYQQNDQEGFEFYGALADTIREAMDRMEEEE